ncbi:MAG TPA: hypothetical protein VJK25_04000 [Patescibacteria group bacterium]|nr:hypothetical protein [Patescibacteria group bacterium]
MLFITAALIMYSLAIWTEHFSKEIRAWMVITFSAALTCDLIGTGITALHREVLTINLHGLFGFLALTVMALHFCWAFIAITRQGKAAEYFHCWSTKTWCIWLVAFVSGTPLPKIIMTVLF